mmetsp:Transcript_133494/g.302816  ORF Transcript_133494/g.302816 Transcript_133494/m.302816 type:complete len:141 (-) Transcript_133494:564-986(-)|eukprot:CAMPEP_0204336524 /NCGR_PEP_ID=MMETSP0469-20131031/19598_1 /ASSEMBLY_ACC=CAM_ASM_000384 /TAXON_ID=2969 /ORGANISM="Oxyrrhis marina" /LENGTH=140 /DNA_ID=CAMNT_0051320405 /DNA_START=95 /DNA_END=520 /DNA_ORIENTATION=-
MGQAQGCCSSDRCGAEGGEGQEEDLAPVKYSISHSDGGTDMPIDPVDIRDPTGIQAAETVKKRFTVAPNQRVTIRTAEAMLLGGGEKGMFRNPPTTMVAAPAPAPTIQGVYSQRSSVVQRTAMPIISEDGRARSGNTSLL